MVRQAEDAGSRDALDVGIGARGGGVGCGLARTARADEGVDACVEASESAAAEPTARSCGPGGSTARRLPPRARAASPETSSSRRQPGRPAAAYDERRPYEETRRRARGARSSPDSAVLLAQAEELGLSSRRRSVPESSPRQSFASAPAVDESRRRRRDAAARGRRRNRRTNDVRQRLQNPGARIAAPDGCRGLRLRGPGSAVRRSPRHANLGERRRPQCGRDRLTAGPPATMGIRRRDEHESDMGTIERPAAGERG